VAVLGDPGFPDLEKFKKWLAGPEAIYETEKRAYEDQRKHMEKMLRDIFKICKKENKLPGSPRLP